MRLQVATGHHTAETLTALANELLDDIERVFIDKIKVVAPKQLIDAKADDLVRLMRAELTEPGFQLATKEILEELRNAMPREIADELSEDALDDLLEEAVTEVTLSLHSGAAE